MQTVPRILGIFPDSPLSLDFVKKKFFRSIFVVPVSSQESSYFNNCWTGFSVTSKNNFWVFFVKLWKPGELGKWKRQQNRRDGAAKVGNATFVPIPCRGYLALGLSRPRLCHACTVKYHAVNLSWFFEHCAFLTQFSIPPHKNLPVYLLRVFPAFSTFS